MKIMKRNDPYNQPNPHSMYRTNKVMSENSRVI